MSAKQALKIALVAAATMAVVFRVGALRAAIVPPGG